MSKIKTLIELFDAVQIENVVAGLRFKPEKIVFIGFKEIMTKKKMKLLTEFFSEREEHIELDFKLVERYNYEGMVETLNQVLNENEDCCFDLTGGTELVVAAMGTVSALHSTPMFQINVKNGNFIRVRNCENIIETEKSHLNLAESVKLNGCCITHIEKDDYEWKLTSDFRKDIQTMWDICRVRCGAWNTQSAAFENYEKLFKIDDELRVTVDLQKMTELNQEVYINRRIVNALVKKSLILDYIYDDNILSFRYKNEQVHLAITKAGNILELYSYMILKEIEEENPGYYDDIDIGVYIDWDGIIHDEDDTVKDTKNEVDIMVMRDLVPIFISCKNGEVHKEALYELSVVADRFGGRYAKKILLTTYISSDKASSEYIRKRADAMGITIVDELEKKTRQEFKAFLRKKIK